MKDRPVLGFILIAIGGFFLLKMLGIINISIFQVMIEYWPVALIIMGLGIIFKRTGIAFAAIFLFAIIASAYGIGKLSMPGMLQLREVVQTVPVNNDISSVDVEINYGAGSLEVTEGKTYLARNVVQTTDKNDPIISFSESDGIAKLQIERNSFPPSVGQSKDSWKLELNPFVTKSLKMSFGASDVKLDLTDMKIDSLEMDGGASSQEITFGNHPTKATIQTGASSIKLRIPKDIGTRIVVDGGLTSVDLPRFEKLGNTYTYKAGSAVKTLDINIQAGASSITGELY